MTESVPSSFGSFRKFVLFILAIIFLVGAGSVVYGLYQTKFANCTVKNSKASNPFQSCVKLEKVDTQETRAMGLSGRDGLADDQGMLFVFEKPGRQCIWMKDMKFNIDVVWIDETNKITKVVRDMSPDSYPKSFCGGSSDQYVIELAPGVGSDDQLKVGNELNL